MWQYIEFILCWIIVGRSGSNYVHRHGKQCVGTCNRLCCTVTSLYIVLSQSHYGYYDMYEVHNDNKRVVLLLDTNHEAKLCPYLCYMCPCIVVAIG